MDRFRGQAVHPRRCPENLSDDRKRRCETQCSDLWRFRGSIRQPGQNERSASVVEIAARLETASLSGSPAGGKVGTGQQPAFGRMRKSVQGNPLFAGDGFEKSRIASWQGVMKAMAENDVSAYA